MGDIPKDIPTNETPDPVQSLFYIVTGFVSKYGWTILFFVVIANLVWSYFYPKYRRWKERLEDEKSAAEYKKDPSAIIAREEAKARAWQKLQEKSDQLAEEYKIKQKEKEEKKRLEKIAELEKIMQGKPSSKPRTLRDEYNPLMGSGSNSFCFRPTSRGNSGGG